MTAVLLVLAYAAVVGGYTYHHRARAARRAADARYLDALRVEQTRRLYRHGGKL